MVVKFKTGIIYIEEDQKDHEMRWWKTIWRREACASIMPKTETSGDDAAEEWSKLGRRSCY